MNAITPEYNVYANEPAALYSHAERLSCSSNAEVLSHIYQEQCNLSIYQRPLSPMLNTAVQALITRDSRYQCRTLLAPTDIAPYLRNDLPDIEGKEALVDDIGLISDMFACLFELNKIGLRLSILESAMCPKFHVDRVPCRLLTTYGGPGTEWLADKDVDRSKLGAGCNGLSDTDSGLIHAGASIQQLAEGHIALLKGELWQGNENRGLVHRSPSLKPSEKRLLLSLDFA